MYSRYLLDLSFIDNVYDYSECIVVGSGIAGLSTAIRISEYAKVKVITKANLSDSTTWFAQGGIAAAVKKPDKWKVHYDDTIKAGQGLSDSDAVRKLVKNAPKMIEDLVELGIIFDISNGEISLTTEGGHSFARVLHAGGDATGEEIEKKLVSYSKSYSKIDFYPEYLAIDIVTHNGIVYGITALNLKSNKVELHPSSNVVIASGGIGQLFELTTNPSISTGDGIAMAYRAGASIKDIEFMQFHPTVFRTNEGGLFLITEALRGEGAYLRDAKGNRFMLGIHPRAELAPRDIVVKEMVKVMMAQDKGFVYLDATHLPESMLKIRFPNIIIKLRENGLNLRTDLIRVFPAAHYLNGGIKTDLKGHTDVKGLYACGECAATGAHGANRLASNSLIEGLVFGWEISKDIISKSKDQGGNKSFQKNAALVKKAMSGISGDSTKTGNSCNSSISKNPFYSMETIEGIISDFRHIMSKDVGILRDEKSLNLAEQFISKTLKKNNLSGYVDRDIVRLLNMLTVGSLIIKAASLRKESRGTHQRNDFPATDDKNWKKHIILKGEKVSFEPVT